MGFGDRQERLVKEGKIKSRILQWFPVRVEVTSCNKCLLLILNLCIQRRRKERTKALQLKGRTCWFPRGWRETLDIQGNSPHSLFS